MRSDSYQRHLVIDLTVALSGEGTNTGESAHSTGHTATPPQLRVGCTAFATDVFYRVAHVPPPATRPVSCLAESKTYTDPNYPNGHPAVPTSSGRPNPSVATHVATSNSAASRSAPPRSCNPSGSSSSASSGSVSAGQPSSDAVTFIAGFPVELKPTGAAPHAPSVRNASYWLAALAYAMRAAMRRASNSLYCRCVIASAVFSRSRAGELSFSASKSA